MAINHFEVCRMEIRDFGQPVTVTTPGGSVFPATMIFDDAVEDTGLGGLQGSLGQPVFRCLPADAVLIGEGAELTTADGVVFRMFAAPIHRAGQLVEIRVIEQ